MSIFPPKWSKFDVLIAKIDLKMSQVQFMQCYQGASPVRHKYTRTRPLRAEQIKPLIFLRGLFIRFFQFGKEFRRDFLQLIAW